MTTIEEKIAKIATVKACEQFAKNAEAHGRQDLTKAAHRRAVELGASSHGAESEVEKECLKAVYAYERTLKAKHGKAVRANYTWRMIRSRGIIPAVERAVNKPHDPAGYSALAKMGLEDVSFEAVVLRHPEMFSEDAVQHSKERLNQWKEK